MKQWRCLVPALAACALAGAGNAAASAEEGGPRDFHGTWTLAEGGLFLGVDLPYTAQGQNQIADRLELLKAGHAIADPHLTCRPTGVAGVVATKATVLILQSAQKFYLIAQEDREVRRIPLRSRHTAHPEASYSGDSIAWWQGNTLVVDTIAFNGLGQLDEIGNPQSRDSHVVERWMKSADGLALTVEYTITDPVYYTRPVRVTRQFRRLPGVRVGDYDCAENPRADDFDNLTFTNEWFRPVCTRAVVRGVAAEQVTCSAPKAPTQAR